MFISLNTEHKTRFENNYGDLFPDNFLVEKHLHFIAVQDVSSDTDLRCFLFKVSLYHLFQLCKKEDKTIIHLIFTHTSIEWLWFQIKYFFELYLILSILMSKGLIYIFYYEISNTNHLILLIEFNQVRL